MPGEFLDTHCSGIAGLFGTNHFNQFQDWYGIEKVHAHHTLGAFAHRSKAGQRQRGGIRCQNGVVGETTQVTEQLLFQRRLLGSRLDDHFATAERLKRSRQFKARHGLALLRFAQLLLGYQLAQSLVDGGLGTTKLVVGHIIELDGKTARDQHLGNTLPHGTGPYHADGLLTHGISPVHCLRASSRSTNFWILPVEVFGSSVKTTVFGTLKRARCSRQCSMMSASVISP